HSAPMHRALGELLGHTGGVVARKDYPELGGQFDRSIRDGELVRTLPGVYLHADVRHEFAARAYAVSLWNDRAVLQHEAAAAQTFWRLREPVTIEVAARTNIRAPGYRFSRRVIPPELVLRRARVLMTTPSLTALDLVPAHGGDPIDD